MNKFSPVQKIAFSVLMIILLPGLLYTVYELNSLSEKEQVLSEIYRQQLETILFSVNQYSWDIANSWVSRIDQARQPVSGSAPFPALEDFLIENPSVRAVFLSDSLAGEVQVYFSPENTDNRAALRGEVEALLQSRPDLTQRLRRYQQQGYRKIEPIQMPNPQSPDTRMVMLLFPLNDARPASSARQFAGMILAPRQFIEALLLPKLRDIANGQFQCAIFYEAGQIPVDPAVRLDPDQLVEQKNIWLFPEFFLGIRPQGQTIEELARENFYENLFLLLLLDLILIGAAWFVLRNVRREMELARLKSDFVSNISHELRTPLALIRMFAETLEMGRVPTEARRQEYYRIIQQETERLSHLVNNILNFSRIEAGKKQYHFQKLNLNQTVEKVLSTYRFHLENAGFALETRLNPHIPDIEGDPEALAEAFINLLDNGVKYSETEKRIEVRSGMENGSVYLEVQDHGIGIAPEDRQKVFEKFHRVSDALVHNTKGSGLGLTLVKHIVEAHHGHIELDSKPGRGSCFRLAFPGTVQTAKESG